LADELRAEAVRNGVDISNLCNVHCTATGTPRTPRGPRGGITKTPTSSTGKRKKSTSKVMSARTKAGSQNLPDDSKMEAILIDNDDENIKEFKLRSRSSQISR
jgi:hypothetical protein